MTSAHPSPLLPLALALLGALAGGCRGCDGATVSARGTLELSPASLVFPLRSVGAQPVRTVTARNLGRAPLTVQWRTPEAPFRVEGLPEVLPPGEHTLTVRFHPTAPGHFSSTLEGTAEGEPPARLLLEAEARAVPGCADPGPCHTVRYDVEAEACVTAALPDGTSCTTRCLVDAVCRAGTCVGEARTCDDGNACTLDACNPNVGCEHFPAPPCPGDGVCGQGVCDPEVGCTVEPLPDGMPCGGGTVTCDLADVCISGTCVQRDPPDGFVCAEATPCQGQGVCVGSTCERSPLTPLGVDFVFDARPPPGQEAGWPTLHDFWMDAAGEMSLAGWPDGVPVLNATAPTPVDATARARRCLLWEGRPVCGDFPDTDAQGAPEAGKVSLLDPATGAARWTYSLRQSRPDLARAFSSSPTLLFVTRLAALGSDRLLVLYEGYPSDAPAREQGRRRYLLAVLDAQGALVAATPLQDPLLERTDHPHPFGLAADALGNGFIAFSPVAFVPGRDGLTASSPTLIVSVTREGQVRWMRTYPFVGGELAVGSGMLLPERAGEALSTIDGASAGQLPGPGRVGIAPGRVVLPPPLEGARLLSAVAAPSLAPAWSYTLPEGLSFSSRRLALARWRPRPVVDRTVALGVARAEPPLAAGSLLVGVEVEGGREAFLCPLQEPAPEGEPLGRVQRLHVAGGRLGLMDAANRTGEDPPFAYGQARFSRFQVPGLSDAPVAWSGEFGGPDHDQQEEPPQVGPTP